MNEEESMSNQPVPTLSEKEAAARLQDLSEKELQLSHSLIRMKAEHEMASKELANLKAIALEKFGTDDIASLRLLYKEGLESNSSKILAFEEGLSDIEKLLNAASQQLAELNAQG